MKPIWFSSSRICSEKATVIYFTPYQSFKGAIVVVECQQTKNDIYVGISHPKETFGKICKRFDLWNYCFTQYGIKDPPMTLGTKPSFQSLVYNRWLLQLKKIYSCVWPGDIPPIRCLISTFRCSQSTQILLLFLHSLHPLHSARKQNHMHKLFIKVLRELTHIKDLIESPPGWLRNIY